AQQVAELRHGDVVLGDARRQHRDRAALQRRVDAAALELDVVALLELPDEALERLRAEDVDLLAGTGLAGIHEPQAAADRLLGQDAALRLERAQADHDGNVAYVPALAQHQHRDDRAVGIIVRVDLATRLA